MLCSSLKFTTTKLTFNQCITTLIKIEHQVSFLSVAVTVVEYMIAKTKKRSKPKQTITTFYN